jgi:hypothetical protein
VEKYGLDWYGSGQGSVEGSCECSDEPLGYIKASSATVSQGVRTMQELRLMLSCYLARIKMFDLLRSWSFM